MSEGRVLAASLGFYSLAVCLPPWGSLRLRRGTGLVPRSAHYGMTGSAHLTLRLQRALPVTPRCEQNLRLNKRTHANERTHAHPHTCSLLL